MPAGGLVTLGAGAVIGGIQWAHSAHQANLARKAAAANTRPLYETPQSENDLSALIQSQGGTGMSDASRQYATNSANQGLSATLNAIQRGGGDVNSVSGVYGKYADSMNSLALHDDALRMQHVSNIASLYQRQSANQDKSYMLNRLDPFKDKSAAIAQQLQAAQQGETAGINTMTSSLLGVGQGLMKEPKMDYNNPGHTQMQPAYGFGGSTAPQAPKNFGYTPQYDISGFKPNLYSVPQSNPGNTQNWTGYGFDTNSF